MGEDFHRGNFESIIMITPQQRRLARRSAADREGKDEGCQTGMFKK
jgi:hypothetical protein